MISRSTIFNLVFYSFLVAAGACGVIYILIPELDHKEALRTQRDAINTTNEMIRAQVTTLQNQRRSLESENPDKLVDQAHKQGLAIPGETVFIFKEDP